MTSVGTSQPVVARMLRTRAIDDALAHHESRIARCHSGLRAVQAHPGRRLLDGTALAPVSRRRWNDALCALDAARMQLAALCEVVHTARDLRLRDVEPSAVDRARLSWLLAGRSVPVPTVAAVAGMAGAEPDRISPRRASRAIEATFAEVRVFVERAERRWDELSWLLDPLDAELRRHRDRLRGAEGGLLDAELCAVAERIVVVRARGIADPLSESAHAAIRRPRAAQVAELRARLRSLGGRVDRVHRLRTDPDGAVAPVRELVDRIGVVEAEVCAVQGRVRVEILDPTLPALPSACPSLRVDLRRLDAMRDRPEPAAAALVGVWSRAVAAMSTAVAARSRSLALLDRHTELRGRAAGYRARLARTAGGAHPAAVAALTSAEILLAASPCDLAAATRALRGVRDHGGGNVTAWAGVAVG